MPIGLMPEVFVLGLSQWRKLVGKAIIPSWQNPILFQRSDVLAWHWGLNSACVAKPWRSLLSVAPRTAWTLATRSSGYVVSRAMLDYHSAYEFSAQFRQWMGISPSAYRR
jgi:hypothetical protein